MPYNPTDHERYDGRDDLVCCSITYPNTYYFAKVRGGDRLFTDWVVFLIEPSYLWHPETRFCPCNAAKKCGAYIQSGIEGFKSLYAETSPGINFSRSSMHLLDAPTDIQAEVLLKEPILLESIIGIAVQSKEQAQREVCRLNLQGIVFDKPIYIVPDFFDRKNLSVKIHQGIRIRRTEYRNEGCP